MHLILCCLSIANCTEIIIALKLVSGVCRDVSVLRISCRGLGIVCWNWSEG